MKKLSNDEFLQKVYNIWGDEYEIKEPYKNMRNKILVRHTKCGYEWKMKPEELINGHGCPLCSGKMKKTTKQFKEEVYNLVSNEYTVMEEYKGATQKILIRHNNCGNEWYITPNKFLLGRRCPKCAIITNSKNKQTTQEEFKRKVFDLVGDEYTVLGEYVPTRKNHKVLMRHNCIECSNYTWMANGANFLVNNSRCPKCYGNIKKTTDEFKQEVFKLIGNEYTILGEYNNSYTKILMRHNCDKCNNYEYYVTPSSFLKGTRCPICNESHGEQEIRKYLIKNDIDHVLQKEFDGLIGLGAGNLSYDFYLSNYNLLIEYQGIQHEKIIDFKGEGIVRAEERFKQQQEHDRRKRQYAKDHNIKLLEIWYWDYDNIEEILDKELIENIINIDKGTIAI